MANSKLPDITALATLAALDEIYVVDKSDTTDSTDGTSKKYAVGITSGFVGVDDTQTLTNKTLTSPTITNKTSTGTDSGAETLANKTLTAPVINGAITGTFTTALTFYSTLNLAEGAVLNGKIVPSVATSNLTVALKGWDGNDPSATNPVYVRIGGTIRSVTAALSVTKNAATNWFNAGATEHATKELDYFVYLGYNATDGVVIGFARISYATRYDSFSATTTSEEYCAISTITTAAAADYYNVVGRFAATLSAGAAYTWSVPSFTATNLIQRPIYETRWLTWSPTITWTGGAAPTTLSNSLYKYRLRGKECTAIAGGIYTNAGTTITKVSLTPPMSIVSTNYMFLSGAMSNVFAPVATMMQMTNAENYAMWCSSATIDRYGFQLTHEI